MEESGNRHITPCCIKSPGREVTFFITSDTGHKNSYKWTELGLRHKSWLYVLWYAMDS